MPTWFADGQVTGFDATTKNLRLGAYLLSRFSTGPVDTNAVTRLGYNPRNITTGAIVKPRFNARAFIRFDSLDNWRTAEQGRVLCANMYIVPAGAPGLSTLPTATQIIAAAKTGAGIVQRATTYSTPVLGEVDATFNFPGVEGPSLLRGAKYWLLVLPTALRDPATTTNLGDPRQDPTTPLTDPNTTGRIISFWTNRRPGKPVFVSPPNGSLVASSTMTTVTFTASDPDSMGGGTASSLSHRDMAGVQMQIAPAPVPGETTPPWRDVESVAVDNTTRQGGFFIAKGTNSQGSNAMSFATSLSMVGVWAGSDDLSGAGGATLLPSGSWRLRIRTFDWGHPGPDSSVYPGNVTSGDVLTPDTMVTLGLASEWSEALTLNVVAQVPPPIPRTPAGGSAVLAGSPVTFSWTYRNTATASMVPPGPYPQARYEIEYHEIGNPGWVLISPVSGTQSSHTIYPTDPNPDYILSAGTEYEWRVRVQDSQGVWSEWSGFSRFWAVTGGSTDGVLPTPEEAVEGATLGCGKHRAFIFARGGEHMIGEIPHMSIVDWGRIRDDISTAKIEVRKWDVDCGNLLASLNPWAHELVIFRGTGSEYDRVWEGPITLLTYAHDKVVIDAKDVNAYLYRRVIRQAMNDSTTGDSVVSRAARIARNVLAPSDPNVLAHLTVVPNADDPQQRRNTPPYSRTAFEEIDDMASNSGLDYTAVGRRIIFWGTHFPLGWLPELRDQDLGASPIVSVYGMQFANSYTVSNGAGIWGTATRLPEGSEEDPQYGLVEMLSSSWASDSGNEEDTYTNEGAERVRESFVRFSERSIESRHPMPVVVRVPENTTLSPNTPLSINHLVPGVAVPVRAVHTLRQVVGVQKLDSIRVREENGEETISITLSRFDKADDSMEGEV